MSEPIGYVKDTKKLKPTADELRSQWVLFPTDRFYLLPKIANGQKFVPIFNDDGTISMEVEESHQELPPLIQKVMDAAGSVERNDASVDLTPGGQLALTPAIYSDFMALVRALLGINYDFSTDELKAILTCSAQQFAQLFGTILKHINAR